MGRQPNVYVITHSLKKEEVELGPKVPALVVMTRVMKEVRQLGNETNAHEDNYSEASLCLSKLTRVARDVKKATRELRDDENSRREEVELSSPRIQGSVVGKVLGQWEGPSIPKAEFKRMGQERERRNVKHMNYGLT